METLSTYLAKSGVRQGDLAKALGIKPPHMSLLVSGRRKPSRSLAAKIATATNGAVPVSCWDEEPAAARAS